jgi:hypothetical protein
MLDLAKLNYFIFASEEFSRASGGRDDPERTCYKIKELGPSLSAVNLGSGGYLAFTITSL